MKICILNNWFPPDNYAGSGIYVYALSNALAEAGHEVTVLYDRDAFLFKSGGRKQADMPRHKNLKVIPLESGYGNITPILTHQTGRPLLKRNLLKKIFKEPFDVIHFNNVSLMGAPDLYTFGKGIKVSTLHDYWHLCPLSTLFKNGEEICDKKSCFSCMLKGKKPPQLWRSSNLIKNKIQHLDAFIAPSLFSKTLHTEKGISRPIFHLPYMINSSMTLENEPEYQNQDYFLFAGRLERVKGVQKIIPSFQTGAFGKLIIAGDGSYRQELEKLADNSPYIEFTGYLNQEKLQELYQNAIATIVSSIWYEVVGIVMLDSMQMKIPVIAHDLAGPGEIVKTSKGGLLYSTREEFEAALTTLRKDIPLRKKLGEAGHKYVLQTHTRQVHLDNYLSIIEHLKKGNNASDWQSTISS